MWKIKYWSKTKQPIKQFVHLTAPVKDNNNNEDNCVDTNWKNMELEDLQ